MVNSSNTGRKVMRLLGYFFAGILAVYADSPAQAQYPRQPTPPRTGYQQPYGNRYGGSYQQPYGNRYGGSYQQPYGNRYGAGRQQPYGNRYGTGYNQGNRYGTGYNQGNRYGTGYNQGNRYGTGYNQGGRYGNQFQGATSRRDPRTGRFNRQRGTTDPRSRTQRGRTTPTPRAGAATPAATPGGAQSTRNQQGARTLQGKARTPMRPKGKVSKGPAVTATFIHKPLPDVACVYMTPMQTDVAVGEEFETQLSLSNPGGKTFQTVDVALRFNPMVLEPLRLDDDPILPLLDGESEALVFAEAGVLYYKARLARPLSAQATSILTIRWKTMGLSPHTEVDHADWRGLRTALCEEGEPSILGGSTNEGALGMSLQIYSPEEREDGPPIGEEALFAGAKEAERGDVKLRLLTNEKKVSAGEDFYVGVWYENPRLVDISKIALKLRFDPRVLEVVDDDTDNWIATGVNIYDGDYHEKFPFDIHIANTVENNVGTIRYAMACTQQRALPERGYLARIRFRPKALAKTTRIQFEFSGEDDSSSTQVRFLGGDVLGETDTWDDGAENLALSIVTPERSRILTAEK